MSYFKDIDTWLDELLAVYPTDDDVRRLRENIKAKLLESYRNGQSAQQPRDEAPHERDSRAGLPTLGAQGGKPDPVAHVKFFTPDAGWTWYATEGEPEGDDFLFFGYVEGVEAEWGYFRLSELQSVRGRLGLTVERDLWFTPQPVSAITKVVDASSPGATISSNQAL